MDITAQLTVLPDKPGVYLMKDDQGKIIYVGKATSLRQRVRSYFQKSKHHTLKERSLIKNIYDFETIVVDSPVEALILECNLIKQHRPKYNIRLRDDKHYPYIKITLNETFPRALVVRSIKPDQGKYFGPYTNSTAMHETLKIIKDIFPLRSCRKENVDTKTRACLNAHISKCASPCAGKITEEKYREMVDQVILFLEGRRGEVIKDLENKMKQAAEELNFEEAARYRDQIQAVRQVVEKQKIENQSSEDRDVVGLATDKDLAAAVVFFVRGGKVMGREHFFLTNVDHDQEAFLLGAFLQQYYAHAEEIPGEIVVQGTLADQALLEEWLTKKRGLKVRIHQAQRGDKKRLLDLVIKNARIKLDQHHSLKNRRKEEAGAALEQLRQELNLPQTPHRIECYDISNTQGTNSVGSMIGFVGGEPCPAEYRRFKVKTVQGPNDFASLQEVLSRRIQRGLAERRSIREAGLAAQEAKFAHFPDLMIIDGGKGQLSAVKEILDQFALSLPVFGLAEEFEHLYRPEESTPIVLAANSPAYYLVQRVRNEAHRFAITYHRKLRSQEQVKSVLDDIPGIGPARRKALLKAYGSVEKIAQASPEELSLVEGMNRKVATNVVHFFNKKKEKNDDD
jgi:excinuclease ABC subunit C